MNAYADYNAGQILVPARLFSVWDAIATVARTCKMLFVGMRFTQHLQYFGAIFFRALVSLVLVCFGVNPLAIDWDRDKVTPYARKLFHACALRVSML